MMVIQNSNGIIYPADRCTWQIRTDPDGNGYNIHNVRFYPGSAGTGTDPADGHIQITTGTDYTARLGLIGKSGRFVPITDVA